MAMNRAERLYQATAQSWPRKLMVTPTQYDIIGDNALKDGVSPKFFKQWAEDYLDILVVLDAKEPTNEHP